jgi:hypothetical protein
MLVYHRIDNKTDHLKGVKGQACRNYELGEAWKIRSQNAINKEVAVFVIEERQQLQRHQNDEKPVAVCAFATQKKEEACVRYYADEKENSQRGQTDATQKKKADEQDGCAVITRESRVTRARGSQEK